MIYAVFYDAIKIGCLEINEKGQHRYTPVEERMEYIKTSCSIFYELCEKSEWREPIPLFKNRIEDARRFHCEKDIQNQTDDFRLLMISPDVSAKKERRQS